MENWVWWFRDGAGAPPQPPSIRGPATAMSWSRQARPPEWGWRASSTTAAATRPRCRGLDKLDHQGDWRPSSTTADPQAGDRDVVVSTSSTTKVCQRAAVASTGSTTGARPARLLGHRRPAPCRPRCRGLDRLDHRSVAGAPPQPPPTCGPRPRCRGLDRLDHRGVAGAPPRPPPSRTLPTAMSWSRQARPPERGWRAPSPSVVPSPGATRPGLDRLDHRKRSVRATFVRWPVDRSACVCRWRRSFCRSTANRPGRRGYDAS